MMLLSPCCLGRVANVAGKERENPAPKLGKRIQDVRRKGERVFVFVFIVITLFSLVDWYIREFELNRHVDSTR